MSRIYLDHNATTHPSCRKKAYQAALDHYGNPSASIKKDNRQKSASKTPETISSCLDCASERLILRVREQNPMPRYYMEKV